MLIKLSIENFKSFDQKEEFSMISSSGVHTNKKHCTKIGQTNLLKNAVIYGENASGKSNLVSAFSFIQSALQDGLSVNYVNDFCRNKEKNRTRESIFELQFTVEKTFYVYGFSAILNQQKIAQEWLYELMPNGETHELFVRSGNEAPTLGDAVHLSDSEKIRFHVYAEDFAGCETRLFLAEMNDMKTYEKESGLLFFNNVFNWIMQNIIVINPDIRISNTAAYYDKESLSRISKFMRTFDTGITDIKKKEISMENLRKILPSEMLESILHNWKRQMQNAAAPDMPMACRVNNVLFSIRLKENFEPEITTLILQHGKSVFDFSEESEGTKRLFDLADILLTDHQDITFIVDELDRSLHPNLVAYFLELFMETHAKTKTQLIFTTCRNIIVRQPLFRRDEVWLVEKNGLNSLTRLNCSNFSSSCFLQGA